MNEQELRHTVRQLVVAALERSSEPPAPALSPSTVLVLFCGPHRADAAAIAQLNELARQGFSLAVVRSHSHRAAFDEADVRALFHPQPAEWHESIDEPALVQLAAAVRAALVPELSETTAAKVAQLLGDSTPAAAILGLLQRGTPVLAAPAADAILPLAAGRHPRMPPPLLAAIGRHFRECAALGVTFCAPGELAATLAARLAVPRNETPERLRKSTPSPRRDFITADDIYEARAQNRTAIAVAPLTVVTDEARELAARFAITFQAVPSES